MSILFQKRKAPAGRRVVVRKAGEVEKGKDACLSCAWQITLNEELVRISFSRDNLHVWITGHPADTIAHISDHNYDVDLYFEICPGYSGHIFSDVNNDRTAINNYLHVNGTLSAETVLTFEKNSEHFKNIRKGKR
ncbi:uncharacterized protein LOC110465319 [Mizuhopecten yessoensis]|uniref:Uncharacterized protein n=1 Tax=Mizuhopecten yessoensis TaxID=6573 RepID=A0A210PRT4_MIZYE|nr:uncharacterized protein LOC110465319 [Mizuhopecten yessoensis]OWF39200.1 hypothetical protein KP79_PYT20340 [Mizuhopecten yessoensis]